MKSFHPVVFSKVGFLSRRTRYGLKTDAGVCLPAEYAEIRKFEDRFFVSDGAQWHLYDHDSLIRQTGPLRSEPFLKICDMGEHYFAASISRDRFSANEWRLYDKDWNQLILYSPESDEEESDDEETDDASSPLVYCDGLCGVVGFADGYAAVLTKALCWHIIDAGGCVVLNFGNRMPMVLAEGFFGTHGNNENGDEMYAVYDLNGHRILYIPDPWHIAAKFPGRSDHPQALADDCYRYAENCARPLTLRDGFFTLGDFTVSGADALQKFNRYVDWFMDRPGITYLGTHNTHQTHDDGVCTFTLTFSTPDHEKNSLFLDASTDENGVRFSFRVPAGENAVMPMLRKQSEPIQLDKERIDELCRYGDSLWNKAF